MIHRGDEEPAGAACGVDDPLVGRWVEHAYCHATGISRSKKLAAVTSKVRANDLLISYALHVYGRREEREAL